MAFLKVTKLTGAGNTFLAINIMDQKEKALLHKLKGTDYSAIAKELCNPFQSIGADGMFFLDDAKNSHNDFMWHFFNADGSSAEMCGNATRCVAIYAQKNLENKKSWKFETLAGTIEANIIKDNSVQTKMTQILESSYKQSIELPSLMTLEYDFFNTGVPHVVVETNDIYHTKYLSLSDEIKEHNQFQPKSTNVTLLQRISDNAALSLTYERGVTGYTQACGTGAVAAAKYLECRTKEKKITITVPGGILHINLENPAPILTGPAKIIAEIMPL